MKFERLKSNRPRAGGPWTRPISPVSQPQLLRGLRFMHGATGSRASILTDKDGSYLRAGGCGMCCCLEWHDARSRRHRRAYQQPPVVPWSGVTRIFVVDGELLLHQDEYFRIHQVTEAFLAFFHHRPFPEYIQWRVIKDELELEGEPNKEARPRSSWSKGNRGFPSSVLRFIRSRFV